MSKFSVGDTVWEHGIGWGKIVSINNNPYYPIKNEHNTYTESGKRYTESGKRWESDKLPTLLTVEEAREFRIPDPPREPIEGWVKVYSNGAVAFRLGKSVPDGLKGEDCVACVKVREVEDEN